MLRCVFCVLNSPDPRYSKLAVASTTILKKTKPALSTAAPATPPRQPHRKKNWLKCTEKLVQKNWQPKTGAQTTGTTKKNTGTGTQKTLASENTASGRPQEHAAPIAASKTMCGMYVARGGTISLLTDWFPLQTRLLTRLQVGKQSEKAGSNRGGLRRTSTRTTP